MAEITKCVGKDSKEEHLQSRFSRATIVPGDAYRRSMNEYGKKAEPAPAPIMGPMPYAG
jgi:hypothetical protein